MRNIFRNDKNYIETPGLIGIIANLTKIDQSKLPANTKTNTNTNTQWWDSAINNLSGWLSGAADLTRSIKGNPEKEYIFPPQQNNTNTYIAIGAVGLVVVLVLVFALKK